jgi:hypothetical protein
MITRMDVNDYVIIACNLVDLSLQDDPTPLELDKTLKFTQEFIQEKMGVIRTDQVSLASKENAQDEKAFRESLCAPLITLERAITAVLDAKSELREQKIELLKKDTRNIKAEAGELRLKHAESPKISSRPTCQGFKGPAEVLLAIKGEARGNKVTSN